MPYPRPFKPGSIEAVADVGDLIALVDSSGFYIYRVAYIEAFPEGPPLIIDVSNGNGIAAATPPATPGAAAAFQVTGLNMNYGVVAQLRAELQDDFLLAINLPGGAQPLHTTQGGQALLGAYDAVENPDNYLTELYVFEQQVPTVTPTNLSQLALVDALVQFYGFKYVLAGPEGIGAGTTRLNALAKFDTINDLMESQYKVVAILPIGGIGR